MVKRIYYLSTGLIATALSLPVHAIANPNTQKSIVQQSIDDKLKGDISSASYLSSQPVFEPKAFCRRYDCIATAGALVSATLFGVSVGLYADARNQQLDLGKSCGRTGSCSEENVEKLRNEYTISNYLAIAAGATFIATVIRGFFRTEEKKDKSDSSFKITPSGVSVKF